MNEQFQIRVIATRISSSGVRHPTFGISIPKYMAHQFLGIRFFIEKSGNSILLRSGAEIPNYESIGET
ncbi:MAG: hypothetical protein AABY22_02695 [Nanoarchaeota archaeon]